MKFLRGVSGSPDIAWALEERGYGDAEHAKGLRLLTASYPFAPGYPGSSLTTAERNDEESSLRGELALLRALIRTHAPKRMSLFKSSQGKKGKRVISTLYPALVGISGLAKESKADSEDGRLIAMLERRGFGAAHRAELIALIEKPVREHPESAARAKARAAAERGAREARQSLYRWLTEWTLVAKVVIKRKDWLVRLGLASRQRPATKPAQPM
ncbi:MAG: hypothetical protein U0271_39245 [Polyangiaceae bacterium]